MVDFKALSAPFPPEEVSWRLGSTSKEKMRGMALAYLDARNVMDRLDDVCGPAGWQCRYSHANGKTVCDIAVKCGDEWVWKADGAGDSDIEAEKGSLSDAFKRAGVRWGIGRYLYHVESPWVEIEEAGRSFRIKKGEYQKLDMALRRANQAILNPPPAAARSASTSIDEVKNEIAQQQNAGERPVDGMNQYQADKAKKAETFVTNALGTFALPGQAKDSLNQWWKDNTKFIDRLEGSYPNLHERLVVAFDKAMDDAATRVAA